MVCTFFGHRECCESIRYALKDSIIQLIENADVVVTYVRRNYGGATKYKKIAKRKGREIVEI